MISYSLHLSAKGHAVSTTSKLGQVTRHNLRRYGGDHDIEVIAGSDTSIMDGVRAIYDREFVASGVLDRYNDGRRPDRQIHDYLHHVSDSRGDVAAELIIQIGDKDYWADHPVELRSDREDLVGLFSSQLDELRRQCPDFKIASAVVHLDEQSPHMHVVGVPVAHGYKRGMEAQVAKTKVFTRESLAHLQDTMRVAADRDMQSVYLLHGEHIRAKGKGRNFDMPKEALGEWQRLADENERLARDNAALKERIDKSASLADKLVDPKRQKPIKLIKSGGEHINVLPVPEAVRRSQAAQRAAQELGMEIGDLTRQRDDLAHEIDGLTDRRDSIQEEVSQVMPTADELHRYLSDAVAHNYALSIADETCKQLRRRGLVDDLAYMQLDHRRLMASVADQAANLLDRIRDHIVDRIQAHTIDRDR